jgi:hypothetical protein
LALAQVVPDREAAIGAHRVLEAVEHLRGAHLAAAPLAEQLALYRVQGDHVVARPRPHARSRLAELGVDAADEHVDVVEEAAPAPAVAAT